MWSIFRHKQTTCYIYIVGTVELHDLLFWGMNLKMEDSLVRNIMCALHSVII